MVLGVFLLKTSSSQPSSSTPPIDISGENFSPNRLHETTVPMSSLSVTQTHIASPQPSPVPSSIRAKQNGMEIVWTADRKLTYDDFQRTPPAVPGTTAAESSVGVGVNSGSKASCQNLGEYLCTVQFTDISVQARFNTYDSWMVPDGKVAYVLAHEQLHFDIAELMARKFRKTIPTLTAHTFQARDVQYQKAIDAAERELNTYLDAAYNRMDQDLSQMQMQYDNETNHGTIDAKQAQWRIMIQNQLEQ
jgi:hypothetical protein